MATEREMAIRREMDQAKQGKGLGWIDAARLGSEWDVKQWKPKQGDNFVAFVPPEAGNIYFGYKVFIHYDMGPAREAVLCPAAHNKGRCPICEERDALQNEGYENEELRPYNCFPPRFLFLIVDVRNEETAEAGIQFWCAPNKINDEIFALSLDKRTQDVIDIADLDGGKDFLFAMAGKGLRTDYKGCQLEKRQIQITDKMLAQIDGMPWFDDFLFFKEYEELAEMLDAAIKSRERAAERGTSRSEREVPKSDRGARSEKGGGRSRRDASGSVDYDGEKEADAIPFDGDAPEEGDAGLADRLKEKVESGRSRRRETPEMGETPEPEKDPEPEAGSRTSRRNASSGESSGRSRRRG